MTSYFVGDVPAEDLVIDPARGGTAVDLDPFDEVTVTFRGPDGEVIESSGFAASIDTDTVLVEWPDETILDTPGVYELSLTLESTGGLLERLTPIRIVVEEQGTGWYTIDMLREDWPDAPDEDVKVHLLLEEAKSACLAYGNAAELDEDGRPPYRWRGAQLSHVRTLWNAGEGDSDGQVGLGGFVVVPKSLEKSTREILRPKTISAVFG